MKQIIQAMLRANRIISTFMRLIIIQRLFSWRIARLSEAVRFRLALEELGGTWIKLGQVLALRFDILPAEYCYELFKLLNQVASFPYETVRTVIQAELGDYPEKLFGSFEETAFAAASIGQVHRAELKDGTKVVVKVQRPNIQAIMASDIRLMYSLSGVIDFIGLLGASSAKRIIDEFASTVYEEMDYRNEARHATMIARNSQNDKYEVNPKVFWDYSSERVLTAEAIDGIPLINILEAIGKGNHEYLQALEAQGYKLKRIAQRIDLNMLNQIFVHGYFHADLHPANLFVMADNAIAYVDFGIVGRLSSDLRESLLQYTWLFFEGDSDRAIRHLMRWVQSEKPQEYSRAYRALVEVHEKFLFNLAITSKGQKDLIARFAIDIFDVVRQERLVLAPELVLFLRTLVTVSTLRYELCPEYDLRFMTQRFMNRMISQEVGRMLEAPTFVQTALNYTVRINAALDYLEQKQLSVDNSRKSPRKSPKFVLYLLTFSIIGLEIILLLRSSVELDASLSLPLFLLNFLVLLTVMVTIWNQEN